MAFNFYGSLDYSQLIFFYCLTGLALLFSTYFFLRRVCPKLIVEDVDSDFIAGLHAALFTITFLTLGYCLVNASETVDNYQQSVVAEANDIKKLDILLTLYNKKESSVLREDLRNYADSIVNDEWPLLAKRTGSERTLNIQRQLRSDLAKLNPISGKDLVIYSDILETTARVIQARSSRISNSGNRLAPQFMLASNVGYICVLLISALMLTQFTWFRFISLNIQIFAVSFIFASTIDLDNPFRGKDRVSPEPIETVALTINTHPQILIPEAKDTANQSMHHALTN